MSRKSKKRARAKFRPPIKASAPTAIGPSSTGIAPRTLSQARVGGDQAVVRAVEMSLGAQNKVLKGPRGRMIVQSADPSIPLDRVPYFTNDLVRLGIVAALMAVLVVAGAFAIPELIK